MSQASSLLHLKRILVPSDLSPASARALTYAMAFARKFGTELVIIHVYDQIVSSPPLTTPGETYQLMESIHSSLKWELEEFAKPILADGGEPIPHRFLIVDGAPVDGIVVTARSEHADLLVISTHGRTGLKHILMGSVAEKVVRYAPCPVFVVREQQGAENTAEG